MIDVGQKLNGRYKLLKPIGSGGMANVFLAQDLILERHVAVKVLRLDFNNEEAALKRFQRESFSSSQLVHPNIVSVYDFGEEDNHQYIVMEYVAGTDLKTYIRQRGQLSPGLAVTFIKQIVSAAAVAHQHKIIHRDIKTQNILIGHDDTAKITDFGIAVATGDNSLTQTNTLLGSVHYLSPEQARGGMATYKTDIYALGVVLYEMLTGVVPFDGESPVAIAMKHFQASVPDIPNVPQSLANVVRRAMAKDPLYRYASCDEMLRDLTTCLSSERANEPRFEEPNRQEDTVVLTPIAATKEVQPTPPTPVRETAESTDAKKHKKKKRAKWPWYVLAAFLLISGVALAMFFASQGEAKKIAVPDVINSTQEEAEKKLKEAGFTIGEVTLQPDEKVAKGLVIETTPARTQLVAQGSKINLVVSAGNNSVTLENYTGRSFDEVAKELQDKGIDVEKKEEYHAAIEAGRIITQNPEQGSKVIPQKNKVYLTVSKGIKEVTLPNFVNNTRDAVERFAQQNSLVVTFIEEASDSVEKGKILRQSINPDTTIKEGDTLIVTVSSGPQPVITFSKEVSVPYRAPATSSQSSSGQSESQAPQPGKVEIFIEDENRKLSDVAETLTITESQKVTLTFTIKRGEAAQYRILVNGEEVAKETHVTP